MEDEEEVEEDVLDEVDVDEDEDVEVEDEVDEDVVVTFPLDVEVEEVLLTPPVEVEEVLLTPPVEVEEVLLTPPVEVDVETSPLDPPEEVEVLVDPVLVEDMTIPPDPPPLPPKKPPAKKPPPKPPPQPPPPITMGGGAAVEASIGAGAGNGTGGCWVVTVTTVGCCGMGATGAGRLRFIVATRCTGRLTTFFATFFLLNSVRGLAFSATWTAPPPISAPPAATAASLAKAIRTDMVRLSS